MLDRLVALLRDFETRLNRQPTFGWAVVSSVAPLQIRYDAQDEPIAGVPDSLVAGLTVGMRVWCIRIFRRDIILGAARGGDTGWNNVTVPGATGTCQWMRVNGIVYLRFDLTLTTTLGAGANRDPVFTLPAAAYPGTPTPINVGGGLNLSAAGRVWTNGNVSIRNNDSSAEKLYRGFGQWPQ